MFLATKNYLCLLVLVLCVGLLSVAVWAQSTTEGAIGGTVSDPQDRVVPNAVVKIKNTGSNLEQTVSTSGSGYYRVGQLQPGTYVVTVKAEGFAPFKAESVIVNVGSLTPVNVQLTIGTTEQVSVSAEAPVINVTSAEFAPTLNETAIQNLPINGGRWSSFALLTPGVVSDASGFGLVSFRGTSTLLNNVTVDGADNNQAYFSEERGRTRVGYSTPKSAIQEFQVNTSNYSAEYGRSAGGVINSVTKSGTNSIHGEAYWYDRNNDWGSMNPFTTLTSAVYGNGTNQTPTGSVTAPYKPVDVRKMGGFAVGGPAIKDKLFWFVAFDKFHRNFPGTAVPNSASTFFQMPNSTFALAGLTSCSGATSGTANYNVCQFAALYNYGSTSATNLGKVTGPQFTAAETMYVNALFGNPATGQLGLLSVTGSVPRKGDQDIVLPKLDWIINQKNHASFSVNRMRWSSPAGIQTQATNNYGTNTFGNDYVSNTWGVAKLDTQLNNNITNQLRFQYGRDFEWETNQSTSAYDNQTLVNPVTAGTTTATGNVNPYNVPPNVYIGSFQWGSTLYGNRIAYPDEYKMQIADTITLAKGNHNFKFGIDWLRSDDKTKNLYQQYAEYSYGGLPQYFADLYKPSGKFYSSYYQSFQGNSIANAVKSYEFTTNDLSLFVQDDWKLTRRLTVNLGLRYEAELMPDPYSELVNSIAVGAQTIQTGHLPNNTNSFGPRVGFAWDIFGDSKTVLRGGYGIYYGRIINSNLYSAMSNTGLPFNADGQNAYTIKYSATCAPTFPQILTTAPSGCSATLGAMYFDKNFTAPQIQQIDLTLQRELGWKTFLSISYLGSLGRHLPNFTDVNLAPSTTSISYTVNNQGVTGMPLADGTKFVVPLYTSRLNSTYGAITNIFSGVNSNYNALAVQLEKRLSNHVQFSVNYTWSHALDYGTQATTTISSGSDNMIDPLNPKYSMYGNSIYNVPNRVTFNAVIEAPWKHSGWLKYVADGWQASPVLQMQTGLGNSLQTASAYPNYIPAGSTAATSATTSTSTGMLGAGGSWYIPGIPRASFRQPATYVADLRLTKSFRVTERFKGEFSADGFNIFNHRNVTGVSSTSAYTITNPSTTTAATTNLYPTLTPYSSATSNGASLFNVPSSANSNYVYGTRQIQLGLKVSF